MKSVLLLITLISTSILCFGQDFPYNEDEKIEFEEIIQFNEELTSADIIDRTEKWANSFWTTPNQASKTESAVTYKVSANSKRSALHTYELLFNLKVSVKEGKYKYTLSDFEVIEVGLMTYTLEKRIKKKAVKEFTWTEVQNLITSLKNAIETGIVESEEDDW
jgi:hypothetical protein